MNLFERKDCMLPVYALAAVGRFGQDALDWDPLILRDAFQAQFGCKLGQKAFDKLMAGTSMIGTNLFTTSIQSFLACTAACNNKAINQNQLCYVNLKDCCWSVFVWRQMIGYNPQQDSQRFDPDIVMYIQALMQQQGISMLPDFLDFAKLDDVKITTIQQALVQDATAFQAYNIRQMNEVQELKAYIRDKQKVLVAQLKVLQQLLKQQEKPFKTAKK